MFKRIITAMAAVFVVSVFIYTDLSFDAYYTPVPADHLCDYTDDYTYVYKEQNDGDNPDKELDESDYEGEYIEQSKAFCPIYHTEAIEFLSRFNGEFSVHFRNIYTGFVFEYNADRVFFGASSTKAHFAFYIYHKAAVGQTNLDRHIEFTPGDYWGGSGLIRQYYEYGATFTQRRLLRLMMANSDNIATRMLRRTHGLEGYRSFIEGKGGDPQLLGTISYSYITAAEAGILMVEIYNFIQSGDPYALELKGDLLANRYAFITSDYPVASKSGWASSFGGAFHDMAIVFAGSPYTLAVLSAVEGTWVEMMQVREISMFFQHLNYTLHNDPFCNCDIG